MKMGGGVWEGRYDRCERMRGHRKRMSEREREREVETDLVPSSGLMQTHDNEVFRYSQHH